MINEEFITKNLLRGIYYEGFDEKGRVKSLGVIDDSCQRETRISPHSERDRGRRKYTRGEVYSRAARSKSRIMAGSGAHKFVLGETRISCSSGRIWRRSVRGWA